MQLLGPFRGPLGIQKAEEVDQFRRVIGLVDCAEASPVVPVKVFIKQDMVAPVGIGLEFLRAAIDRIPALFMRRKAGLSRSAISLELPPNMPLFDMWTEQFMTATWLFAVVMTELATGSAKEAVLSIGHGW